MKSIIFCTSYINDAQSWKDRYQRWLDYYETVPINAIKKIMIDDGSPFLPPPEIIQTISVNDAVSLRQDKNLIIRFDDNLGRQSMLGYPGWWRSFLHAVQIAKDLGVEKIIHIESDAYILTPRLTDFINDIQSGWHVLWTPHYQFPETAIQVICKDQFGALEQLKQSNPSFAFSDIAEKVLPFTSINREFKGDRYSEFQKNRWIFRSRKFNHIPIFNLDFFTVPIPADADFVTQTISRQQVEFKQAEKP